MNKKYQLSVRIDKLTRCIEEVRTGKIIATEVLPMTGKDLKNLKKREWLFDWRLEAADPERDVLKLVKKNGDNPEGLLSIEDRTDHIFVHLLESASYNRGKSKMYKGVPGNLMAFACKLSFEKGYEGLVSFRSKTKLIEHYRKTLGAEILFRETLVLNSTAATNLLETYFPEKP